MSARALIADTSVWIDLFHGLSVPTLEEALEWGTVILPPIVAAELVSGAKTSRDLALISDLLIDLPPVQHTARALDPGRGAAEKSSSPGVHHFYPERARGPMCFGLRDAAALARSSLPGCLSGFSSSTSDQLIALMRAPISGAGGGVCKRGDAPTAVVSVPVVVHRLGRLYEKHPERMPGTSGTFRLLAHVRRQRAIVDTRVDKDCANNYYLRIDF